PGRERPRRRFRLASCAAEQDWQRQDVSELEQLTPRDARLRSIHFAIKPVVVSDVVVQFLRHVLSSRTGAGEDPPPARIVLQAASDAVALFGRHSCIIGHPPSYTSCRSGGLYVKSLGVAGSCRNAGVRRLRIRSALSMDARAVDQVHEKESVRPLP